MQLRLPSVASLPLPAPLARPLQPATAAALSGSARPSWQPSYSAMPEHAGRHMRQPMSGGRLAAAQRQASMRGTSTSVRAQVMMSPSHLPPGIHTTVEPSRLKCVMHTYQLQMLLFKGHLASR